MSKRFLIVLVVLLAASTAIAATNDSNQATTGVPAIRTYLMPDLSLKTLISPGLLPLTAPQPDLAVGAPKRHGFCRCSCGFQCTSDADCGGSSCDPFITCCVRQGSPDAEWFSRSLDQASHKTSPPEALLKANCK